MSTKAMRVNPYASTSWLDNDDDDEVIVPLLPPDDVALAQAFLLQGMLPLPLPVKQATPGDWRQRMAQGQRGRLAEEVEEYEQPVLAQMAVLATLEPQAASPHISPALIRYCYEAAGQLNALPGQASLLSHGQLTVTLARAASVLATLQPALDDASGREALAHLQEAVEKLQRRLRQQQADAEREVLLQRLSHCDPATLPQNLLGQLLSAGHHPYVGAITFTTLASRQLISGRTALGLPNEMQAVNRVIIQQPGSLIAPIFASHPTWTLPWWASCAADGWQGWRGSPITVEGLKEEESRMNAEKVLLVIDMQNSVFAEALFDPAGRIANVNQLIDAADQVVFIQHEDAHVTRGSEAWKIVDELHQPAGALYVSKTACDAFFNTELEALLQQRPDAELIVCGCATDYCVDTTVKNGASRGFCLTVAGDAHTTIDSPYASAQQLIAHHNQVWPNLAIPGSKVKVKTTGEIIQSWSPVAA